MIRLPQFNEAASYYNTKAGSHYKANSHNEDLSNYEADSYNETASHDEASLHNAASSHNEAS